MKIVSGIVFGTCAVVLCTALGVYAGLKAARWAWEMESE